MRERKLAIYVGLILFLIAAYLIRLNFREKPTVIPKNQKVTMVATVKTQPRFSERFQIIEVGDSRLYGAFYPKFTVGDKIKVEGFVNAQGRIFNAKVEKIAEKRGVLPYLAKLRQTISGNIDRVLPASEAALVKGMVLGVDEIGRDLRESLIATGTIHVVVVSGQNLSIVAGLFLGLVGAIGRRISLILATVAVFVYAFLTGFEPPVVRASLIVLFSTIAIYYGRQVMPIWSLTIAALIILFFSPQALFEVSFQLTFAATLGIMTMGQWLQSIFVRGPASYDTGPAGLYPRPTSSLESDLGIQLRKSLDAAGARRGSPAPVTRNVPVTPYKNTFLNILINNAAVATSAYLFTTPIIWWHFERISVLAPAVNTLVAELVAPIMILGFAVAGVSLVFGPLAQILAYFAYVPAFVFVKIVGLFQ